MCKLSEAGPIVKINRVIRFISTVVYIINLNLINLTKSLMSYNF